MKRFTLLFALLLMVSGSLSAQKALRLYGSYAATDFEEQVEPAQAFGFGASFGSQFAALFEAGLEFNMLAQPWKFESTMDNYTLSTEYTNMMIGAYLKVDIPLVIIEPYVKGGIGYYMGKVTVNARDLSEDYDFKGAMGYSVGAGVDIFLGLYGEVVYHMVEQEFKDVEDADPFKYNNFALNVGWKFSF